MPRTTNPLVLTAGVDPLLVRALRADAPSARIRSLPVSPASLASKPGAAPDVVIVEAGSEDVEEWRSAIQRSWGERAVLVAVDSSEPVARIWRSLSRVECVDLGPGFLNSMLPQDATPAPSVPRWRAAARYSGYALIVWAVAVGSHTERLWLVALSLAALTVLVGDLYRCSRRASLNG